MTPDKISYEFIESSFGRLIAGYKSGCLVYLAFVSTEKTSLETMKKCFGNSSFVPATEFLSMEQARPEGTPFQMRVWEELRKIPAGKTVSYAYIAERIGRPKAVRAVGNAVGANPLAMIIPCHRVLPSSGKIGNYRWGRAKKKLLLDWEKENFS